MGIKVQYAIEVLYPSSRGLAVYNCALFENFLPRTTKLWNELSSVVFLDQHDLKTLEKEEREKRAYSPLSDASGLAI